MTSDDTPTGEPRDWIAQLRLWRRDVVTRPLLGWYRKRIPPMSDTEREAIEAGTVWWDAALFTGKPDWPMLLRAPKAVLSEGEENFLSAPGPAAGTSGFSLAHTIQNMATGVLADMTQRCRLDIQ